MFSAKVMRDAYGFLVEFDAEDVRIITLTSRNSSPFPFASPQLRFWYGEPHRIEEKHVDSAGKHLLADRESIFCSHLREIALATISLIEAESASLGRFTEGCENGVTVWRRVTGETKPSESLATESP